MRRGAERAAGNCQPAGVTAARILVSRATCVAGWSSVQHVAGVIHSSAVVAHMGQTLEVFPCRATGCRCLACTDSTGAVMIASYRGQGLVTR